MTRDFPAPVVPDGIVPAAPLESFVPEPVVYTCEPWADAEFGDPAHPDDITNKACPELNAAKEQAQREYLEQQRRQSGEYVDPAELVARGQYEPGAGYPVGSAGRAPFRRTLMRSKYLESSFISTIMVLYRFANKD